MDWRIYGAGILGLIAALVGVYVLWTLLETRAPLGIRPKADIRTLPKPEV